jgi:hypothetical protein
MDIPTVVESLLLMLFVELLARSVFKLNSSLLACNLALININLKLCVLKQPGICVLYLIESGSYFWYSPRRALPNKALVDFDEAVVVLNSRTIFMLKMSCTTQVILRRSHFKHYLCLPSEALHVEN